MPTPEPGVPWTSGGVDDMTSEIEARNDAAEDAAESDTEVAALEAQVTSLPSFVTGPAPHDQAQVTQDGDEVYLKLAASPRILDTDSGASVSSSAVETSLLSAALSPPASAIAAGDQLLLEVFGSLLNNSGVDRTFRFRVDIDGTDVLDSTALTCPASASARQWYLIANLRATGTGGGTFTFWNTRFGISAAGGGDMLFDRVITGVGLDVDDFVTPSVWDITIEHSFSAATVQTTLTMARLTRYRLGV